MAPNLPNPETDLFRDASAPLRLEHESDSVAARFLQLSPILLHQTLVPVKISIAIGGSSYCPEFGGEVRHDGTDGKTFLAKEAVTPPNCG